VVVVEWINLGAAWGPVAGSCGHGDKPLSAIKGGD
jgi:hypothetical protein